MLLSAPVLAEVSRIRVVNIFVQAKQALVLGGEEVQRAVEGSQLVLQIFELSSLPRRTSLEVPVAGGRHKPAAQETQCVPDELVECHEISLVRSLTPTFSCETGLRDVASAARLGPSRQLQRDVRRPTATRRCQSGAQAVRVRSDNQR